MTKPHFLRRRLALSLFTAPLWSSAVRAANLASKNASITAFGAVADGATINTRAIQAAIDQLAVRGGGTVVIPQSAARCSSSPG
jgi:polygalacturonase